jgi:hypothetical protein
MKALPGPILADISANVLAMTLMVLIAVARLSQSEPAAPTPITLTAQPVVPVKGADAIELLRKRLLPGATGFADLDGGDATIAPDTTVLFILDPKGYPAAISQLLARPPQELTIPDALKTADNHWHPDFLALAKLATKPEAFRTGLQLLLTRSMKDGGNASAGAMGIAGASSLSLRFGQWFRAALDVLGLAALFTSLWGLTRLRRWSLKA